MNLLLGFIPFALFAIVDRIAGPFAGVASGAAAAIALLARDAIHKEPPKVLDVGSALIFIGLTLYALAMRPPWSVWSVRLFVDAGLLVLILGSLAVGRPFTLQYARHDVAPELWTSPHFLRTNVVVASAWAAALAIVVLTDALMLFAPQPRHEGIFIVVAALWTAAQFSAWYPRSRRLRGHWG